MSSICYVIFKRLDLEELRPTISLQLEDHSGKYPLCILEDVPIMVGNFYVRVKFAILDMTEDARNKSYLGGFLGYYDMQN